MFSISTPLLLDRFKGSAQSPDQQEDLVLGLPLEAEDRTIYPVFRQAATPGQEPAPPRQVGYLEVSDERSDYTSLEPDPKPMLIIPILAILVLVVLFLIRRSSR
jgi:hypothetical protein